MIRVNSRILPLVLLALTASLPQTAAAGTIAGVVRNGTTGKVVAGQEVLLIQLQAGMETVASTKTDAQGRYTLQHPSLGQTPMLVRVVYRGVNFHQNVAPGRAVADVEVFEATSDPKAFQVVSRAILVQPSGPTLLVGEEYAIRNPSNPPVSYFNADGTFEFKIPEGAEMGQVAAWGPSGMPVAQGTIEKGRNRYAIAFPFRPGENGVRLAYQVPYSANRATLRVASPYGASRISILAPPGLELQANGFQLSGTDQGWNVYTRESVAADLPVNVTVSGTAPAPSSGNERGAGSSAPALGPSAPLGVNSPQGTGVPAQAADSLSQFPARLDSLKWPLIGGFSALFALGVLFLWRKSRGESELAPAAKRAAAAAKTSSGAAELDREVGSHLEEIKETLFRLELRRQAGTISEEEYARERGRTEKFLRDFLKG